MDFIDTEAARTSGAASDPTAQKPAKSPAASDQNAPKAPKLPAEPSAPPSPARSPSAGLVIDEVFCPADVADPFETVSWDLAHGRHQGRRGRGALRADAIARSPPPGANWPPTSWSTSISTAKSNTARAREERAATDPPRLPHDCRLGPAGRLFRHGGRRRALLSRPDLALPAPARVVQFAGLVQRRACIHQYGVKGAMCNWHWDAAARSGRAAGEPLRISASLGLLHPERAGQHGRHHGARPQRGHALQVRLGHGHRPVQRCVRTARSFPAAASRPGRCRSCGSTTRLRRWSRAAARPAARPRCSRSRTGIPTSWSSSSARTTRRRRPDC